MMQTSRRHVTTLAIAVLVIELSSGPVASVYAQLGTGWIDTDYTKRIHLDDEVGLQTFSWSSSESVCSPTACADYNYDGVTDTETFRIFDSRSNRSEIRLQNDYDSGIYQFEGYVTFYEPLHDESLFQIFGNSGSAATYLMMRGYSDNGGEIRVVGGSNTIASGVYGQEVRINVIHEQNASAKFYVNGEFVYEKPDTDTEATNYWKYGVYGTTNGNVPAVVQWRAVRTFRDGLPPEIFPSPPGAYEAEYAVMNGPIVASDRPGYTGLGFADYVNPSGDYVDWSVDSATSGPYDLNFRYALSSGDRPLQIEVNGQIVDAAMSFPATGAWETWAYASIPSLYLEAGTNTIRATAIGSNGPNIDHLLLSPGLVGDLDGDGDITATDWTKFKSGQGIDLAGMSLAESYSLGDLNNDGVHDLVDFLKFRVSYETVHGAGSFSRLLGTVPEPGTYWLLFLSVPAIFRRRSPGKRTNDRCSFRS